MKVVLASDVKGLGAAGDVKDVADGYARNYLVPRGLAVPATPAALERLRAQKEAAARREARVDAESRTLAQRLAAEPVIVRAKAGEMHRLYGSVTSQDIAEAISAMLGQSFDRRKIELDEPIRHLGTYTVPVRIARNVVAKMTVEVQPETGG